LTSDEWGGGGRYVYVLVSIFISSCFQDFDRKTNNKHSCFTEMDGHIAVMMTADELVWLPFM